MKIRFNVPENKNPNGDRGLRVQYGDAKRMQKPWRWYFILFVASLPLLYLFWIVLAELFIIKAEGRVSVPQITVRTAGDGYVSKVFIEPLQTVDTGSQLAKLENDGLTNDFHRIKRELDFLAEEKNKLLQQSGHYASSYTQLTAFARKQKKYYQNRLNQYKSLFQQGAATQAEIATARNQYNSALENLVVKEAAATRNLAATPEFRQVASRTNQLKSELERIELQRQQLTIVSPENGLVTELFAQPGEFLGKGQPLLEMIMPDKVFLSAFISPKYQDYVKVDTIVTVTMPNGESTKAKIVSVPGVTRKSLTEDIGLLETPRSMILAHLKLLEPVKTHLVNGLPIEIRFHYF